MYSRECENGQNNPCGQKEKEIEMEKELGTKQRTSLCYLHSACILTSKLLLFPSERM